MRQAIIERVAKGVFESEDHCFIWENGPESIKCTCREIAEAALEAAGFFDLLEAAEEIYNKFGYVLPLPQEYRLRDAISKAKGDSE